MIVTNHRKNGKTLIRWSYYCHLPKFTCTTQITVKNVGVYLSYSIYLRVLVLYCPRSSQCLQLLFLLLNSIQSEVEKFLGKNQLTISQILINLPIIEGVIGKNLEATLLRRFLQSIWFHAQKNTPTIWFYQSNRYCYDYTLHPPQKKANKKKTS